jgi:hypothetical protein
LGGCIGGGSIHKAENYNGITKKKGITKPKKCNKNISYTIHSFMNKNKTSMHGRGRGFSDLLTHYN